MTYPDGSQALNRADVETLAQTMPRFVTVNDSTVIHWVSYDPQVKVMLIGFDHSVWRYDGIWASDFGALVCAYSIGKVFNERVRNQFDAVRISPEPKIIPRRVSSAG